jgi:adenylate cyclase class 2
MSGDGIEIEAKFYLRHLANLRERLLAQGARLASERQLERNWRFDDARGLLSQRDEVLRLRQDQVTRLTFKQPLNGRQQRREIEFQVDDLRAARAFLEALGFGLIAGYEKYREIFILDSVSVMLDELPFGCFAEIEGPSLPAVRNAARNLGLPWSKRVQKSYLKLFQELCLNLDLNLKDASFKAFEGLPAIQARDLGLRPD